MREAPWKPLIAGLPAMEQDFNQIHETERNKAAKRKHADSSPIATPSIKSARNGNSSATRREGSQGPFGSLVSSHTGRNGYVCPACGKIKTRRARPLRLRHSFSTCGEVTAKCSTSSATSNSVRACSPALLRRRSEKEPVDIRAMALSRSKIFLDAFLGTIRVRQRWPANSAADLYPWVPGE